MAEIGFPHTWNEFVFALDPQVNCTSFTRKVQRWPKGVWSPCSMSTVKDLLCAWLNEKQISFLKDKKEDRLADKFLSYNVFSVHFSVVSSLF